MKLSEKPSSFIIIKFCAVRAKLGNLWNVSLYVQKKKNTVGVDYQNASVI